MDLSDTITFEVYSGRLRKFRAFVRRCYGLAIIGTEKTGGYVNVKVINRHNHELWSPLLKFYREEIKI